jgi:hypothetical protein
MEFYPLGSLPTSYPSWYVEGLDQAGLNAYASATWILSANGEDRFDSPAAHLLPMPPGYRLFRHGHPCYLARAGLSTGDVALWEINEAFASVAVAATTALGLSEETPVAMTGGRMVLTLTHELRRRGGGVGVAAMCAGGGMATALVLDVPGPA